MSRIAIIVIAVLSAYAAGTIAGPPALFTLQEAAKGFSPFMLLASAVLIASLGYAAGNVCHLFRRERDGKEGRHEDP